MISMGKLLSWVIAGAIVALSPMVAMADLAGAPAGRYIINKSTWSGEQFSVSLSTASGLSVSDLTNGECVQAGPGGRLTSAGAACGTGSGSGGGIVSPGTFTWRNDYGLSLSTLTVSSNTVLAHTTFYADGRIYIGNSASQVFIPNLGNGTAGMQFVTVSSLTTGHPLTARGLQGPDIPAGSNNYIQLSQSLQSGATFYVSSGTVNGQFTSGSTSSNPGNVIRCVGNTVSAECLRFEHAAFVGDYGKIAYYMGTTSISKVGSLLFTRASSGSDLSDVAGFQFLNQNDKKQVIIDTFNSAVIIRSTGSLKLFDGDNSAGVYIRAPDVISSSYTLTLPQQDGSSGQVLTTDGNGNLSFASGSGGGNVAFYLRDSLSNIWKVDINTSGALVTSSVASAPAGSLLRTSFVIQDSAAAYWTLTVSTGGALVTASGGTTATQVKDILINDSTGYTWIVTVNTSGALVTS